MHHRYFTQLLTATLMLGAFSMAAASSLPVTLKANAEGQQCDPNKDLCTRLYYNKIPQTPFLIHGHIKTGLKVNGKTYPYEKNFNSQGSPAMLPPAGQPYDFSSVNAISGSKISTTALTASLNIQVGNTKFDCGSFNHPAFSQSDYKEVAFSLSVDESGHITSCHVGTS